MKPNFHIRASGNKTAEILIYGDIGADWFGEGITAKSFAEDLKAIGKMDTLKIRINSAGGDVFDALAIFNTLRRNSARKEVSVDGMALSAASIIAMAGDLISIAENAMLMIHDPWAVTMGTAEDMRKQADLLDQVKENLVTTYENRTGRKAEDVRKMMSAETWMRAKDAVEQGFADEITADLAVAARFDPRRFKNIPTEILAFVKEQQHSTPLQDMRRSRLNDLAARAGRMSPT